ncbi:MAG TPA: hypothetical protein VNM40_02870 [Candidatus Paceibacterota bacterium]|nr:hypothetical protein [Candidatus Paceibacterota bacterium]
MGIATVVIIMVVYTAIEGIVVLRETTATPLQFAIETMFSYFPALALTWVLAAWYYGQIAVSNFQWITGAIIAVFLLMDLLGFTAALAQRLHLTDEFRTQK